MTSPVTRGRGHMASREARLDTFHHCGGGGSDAAVEPRQHAADLARRRTRHKLVCSRSVNDPADETSS